MPTGYTAAIIEGDGITFRQFAMQCARAFGACIELRDEPTSTPIPEEFKPSDYHVKALEDARAKLAQLRAMTPAEQELYGQHERQEAVKRYEEWARKADEQAGKLLAMRNHAAAWEPPSPDHQGMKDFMLQQLDETIKYDGDGSFPRREMEAVKARPHLSFFVEDLKSAVDSVEYHIKHGAEDVQRAAERTKWVRDLHKSLEGK